MIEFLTDLHAHFGGDKITVIWDNLPSHKSKAMTAWIAGQRKWLTVERLPGYAHDLNPIEMVWGNVKTVELANLCPDTIDEAHAAAESGLNRVGSSSICVSPSSPTPAFLYDHESLNYRNIFKQIAQVPRRVLHRTERHADRRVAVRVAARGAGQVGRDAGQAGPRDPRHVRATSADLDKAQAEGVELSTAATASKQ